MKNRFDKFIKAVDSVHIESMTEKELEFLSGGRAGAGGSNTSNTGSQSSFCCDGTCVCQCLPPAQPMPIDQGPRPWPVPTQN